MNATCALAMALLQGRVLTIKTAFTDFSISNLPREIGRSIERKFGVFVTKVKKKGKSKYGVECWWYEYRLATVDYNVEGRKRMFEYVQKNTPKYELARTQKELSISKQAQQLNLL